MTTLTDKAMLAHMSVRQWSARKFDRDVSEEVADIHGANRDAGRFNKLLLPKAALAGLQSAATALRAHHATNTLPWSLDGVGLLPAMNYFPYMGEHKRLARLFETAKADFIDGYQAAKANARERLGDLYREDDYPKTGELDDRIGLALNVFPVPDAADFRVTLGNEEEAKVRAEIEASVNSALDAAVRSLWQRVHDTVSTMAGRLEAYERDPQSGAVKHPFRDSLVGNMRDLTELMGRLNVTGDPALDRMRQRLAEKLCAAEPQQLREDDALRAKAAAECRAVLDVMAAYTGAVPAMAAE